MKLVHLPGAAISATLKITPSYGGRVRAVMSVESPMQGFAEERDFASVEEAQREGIAWAKQRNAEVLLIVGGVHS